jgi:hypothetical protein
VWWMGCAQHITESLRTILCFMCVTISSDSKHQTEMGSQPHRNKKDEERDVGVMRVTPQRGQGHRCETLCDAPQKRSQL